MGFPGFNVLDFVVDLQDDASNKTQVKRINNFLIFNSSDFIYKYRLLNYD
jgi:hypothetical protein